MTKHFQSTDLATTWNIDTSADEWTLAAKATITTDGAAGVLVDAAYTLNEIRLSGDVVSANTNSAVRIDGDSNELIVGKDSYINGLNAGSGIALYGNDIDVLNRGLVRGDTSGIVVSGNDSLIMNEGRIITDFNGVAVIGDSIDMLNEGLIKGDTNAISASGDDLLLVNREGAVIKSDFRALSLSGEGSATIFNQGLIKGQYAIEAGEGETTLINRGHMQGIIQLGDGNDRFDTRGGTFDGTARGGDGDDTYVVSNGSAAFYESKLDGFDTVRSSASYTLAENFERLQLIGTDDRNGYGNAADNALEGNKGDNHLFGKGGSDNLNGRGGNDILTGGAGGDIFIFNKNADHDTVTAFQDGKDLIQSTYADTDGEIADLLANHATQTDEGVRIKFGADSLLLEDMKLNDLDATDFFVWN